MFYRGSFLGEMAGANQTTDLGTTPGVRRDFRLQSVPLFQKTFELCIAYRSLVKLFPSNQKLVADV